MNTSSWGMLAVGLTVIAVGGLIMLAVIPGPKTIQEVVQNTGGNSTSTPTTTNNGGTVGTTTAQWPRTYKNVLEVNTPVLTKTQMVVTGKARTWYFEASFPVEILDSSGKRIAVAPAQAQGDWMTTEFVPFVATLTFPAQPAGSKGTLVLHKDNPSGLPEHDDKTEISITFQ